MEFKKFKKHIEKHVNCRDLFRHL